jgi:hypothetical protein
MTPPAATLKLSASDKTVTGTLTPQTTGSLITGTSWVWSLNNTVIGTSSGNPGSVTSPDYGNVTVTVTYNLTTSEGLFEKGNTGSVTLSENSDPEGTSGDIFGLKPTIFPPECTGNITIKASITDLVDETSYSKSNNATTIAASAVLEYINVPGNSSIDLIFDNTGLVSGSEYAAVGEIKVSNLEFLPAFYNYGEISVYSTIGETADEDGLFDVDWDMKMMCSEIPSWYEGNFSYDSKILSNLITASNTETEFPTATAYTTMPEPTWHISPFDQLPPFIIKWYTDTSLETEDQVAVKRAVLPIFTYKFTITNQLASAVTINNALIKWNWNYSANGTFMNMRTAGDRGSQASSIYTLPKGAGTTRYPGLDFPIYAVLEGYEPGEVVKVYAVVNEWNDTISAYYPETIELTAINKSECGDISMTDFATFLFKAAAVFPTADWTRVTEGSWMNGDKIDVITPQRIAKELEFRVITVTTVDDKSIDDTSAVISIEIKPNTTIDSKITAEELATYISKIHYFNTEYPYAASITIPRSEIAAQFRETLWQTFESAVVLESSLSEPLHYLNFTVYNYA